MSVAYYALVRLERFKLNASTDAKQAAWFCVSDLPKLAFDHDQIITTATQRLRGKVRYQPIGFELLPERFTLTQLQHLYETVLERELDKRNFRKKITGYDFIVETDEIQSDVAHRAARLYRFDRTRYERMVKKGINFEV